MKQPNPLTVICGADDYQKLVGYKIVNVEDTADEDGNESVILELMNDFGVCIDLMIGEETFCNQPYVKEM